jgi:hypothetical protein
MNSHTGIVLILTLASPAAAVAVVPEPAGAVTVTPAGPTPPASERRYELPWQLQSVATSNGIRLDSAAAVFNDANGNLDAAVTTVLSASYQITREWVSLLRLGFVGNNAPGAALDGSSFVNPVVGAKYAREIGGYRLAFFGATTIPIGTGGGNGPELGAAKTNDASMTARPADQAMFAVNYVTAIVGADFAYVNHGFTAQGEATLQQSVRVRGGNSAGATDLFRSNSTVGLHLGHFIGSHFSLGADLFYQRWLSHPTARNTMSGPPVRLSDANMDTLTVALGPRLHFKVGKQGGIHPGLSFWRGFDGRGFDAPLLTAQTTAVQLDVPVTF